MKLKHSALPWNACHAREDKCTCGHVWSLPDDFPVFTRDHKCVGVAHTYMADTPDDIYASIDKYQAKANADFIELACNSYYETQARLADAENLVKKMGEAIYMAQHHSENADGHDPKDLNWEIVNDLCKDAIASAKAFLAPPSTDGKSS